MIHLAAMPGYPSHPGMDIVKKNALQDLQTLQDAGFNAVLVENDNDQPHTVEVSDAVSEAFADVMKTLIDHASIPVGMEIIYDTAKTMRVAHDVGAAFVRFDVFVDTVETKWGIVHAQARKLMALKNSLGARELVVLTDIQVKHAKMLEEKPLSQSAKEAIGEGADGVIVTSDWTGKPPTIADCKEAKFVAGATSVLVGSGFTTENASELLSIVDGAIVGTSIKKDGFVNLEKAKELVTVVERLR